MSDPRDTLRELFQDFPGIGERQARRFVYFLESKDKSYIHELSGLIETLAKKIKRCEITGVHFYSDDKDATRSPLALNETRDRSTLLVVENDMDLETIEAADVYDGMYFVLGGTAPALAEHPEEYINLRGLRRVIENEYQDTLEEVIVATSLNPDGETTREVIEHELEELADTYNFSIKRLGRGLSSGTEIEYVDADTMKSALDNRSSS